MPRLRPGQFARARWAWLLQQNIACPLADRLLARKSFKLGVLFVSDFGADGFGPKCGHRIHPIKSTSSPSGTIGWTTGTTVSEKTLASSI